MVALGTKYDDASWHSGGVFPADLPAEAGGTHIAMFVAWGILSGMAGDFQLSESADEIERLRKRRITPGEFFLHGCDGKFTDECFNSDGNAFTCAYYALERGGYVLDYERTLRGALPSTYHVPDSWSTYDELSPLLDRRFAEWRARNGRAHARAKRKPWWRFW